MKIDPLDGTAPMRIDALRMQVKTYGLLPDKEKALARARQLATQRRHEIMVKRNAEILPIVLRLELRRR